MRILCEICGQDMEVDYATIYPGTSDRVAVVLPCCDTVDTAYTIARLEEYILPELTKQSNAIQVIVADLAPLFQDEAPADHAALMECIELLTSAVEELKERLE